jgi:putative tricarboxylic transport membrane protein
MIGAISFLLQPNIILCIVLGAVTGLVLGAIPGLSGGMAIMICLPLTFGMDPMVAITILMSIYVGGISGGYIGSILLGIPGTVNSIATVYDGYELTKQGHPTRALSVAAVANFFGTVPSLLVAMFLSQVIARLAVKLGPAEYFSLCLFAVILVIALSKDDMVKGIMSMAMGMALNMIGISPISATKRFTFGLSNLQGGFGLACVMMGIFGGTLVLLEYARSERTNGTFSGVKIEGFKIPIADFISNIGNIIRSFLIGLVVGFMPGMGGTIANVAAYSIAKNSSKHPEEFGKGCIDGVWAPEVANNASIGGAVIPMIALGIPGDSTTALLLSAMTVQGLTVGPLLFTTQTSYVYLIFMTGIVAATGCLLFQIVGMKGFPLLFKVPYHYLYPVILVCSFIGIYSANYSFFELAASLVFIMLGVFMGMMGLPTGPFILTFVLTPMLEKNFRNAVSYAQNGYMTFVTSPIALALLLGTAALIIWPLLKNILKRKSNSTVAS